MDTLFTTNKMDQTLIFNPNGDDRKENRKIWFGNTTNLMNLNSVKYDWAVGLYNQMKENFWIPERTDVTQDVTDYKNLTNSERKAYNGILSYLTFLDSVQVSNIPHLKVAVTAPEVSMCMAEQASQEVTHSKSYQVLIESIIPSENRNSIYDFWREDKVLFERCKFIAQLYQQYIDNPKPETYFIALIADYILESIFFYNGFNYFYSLANRMLMAGSSDMFRQINRDELSHVRLYQKLIPEAMKTMPYSEAQIYQMFDEAVQKEIWWTNHIVGNDVLGITEHSTNSYTKYLANQRLKAIGLNPIYDEELYKKNPYKHLEKFADTKKEANTKANFFEATVSSYSMSTAVSGWDF